MQTLNYSKQYTVTVEGSQCGNSVRLQTVILSPELPAHHAGFTLHSLTHGKCKHLF